MEIADYAREYEESTKYFAECVKALSDADLDKSKPDGWSPRQVIHHLADSEAQSYARLRRLVAEPVGSSLQGYDESAWAQNKALGYKELPIENSLAVYLSVRAGSLDILKRLTLADLDRYGEHSERGKFTIHDWIRIYSKHPRDHAGQIVEALAN
ncbi:MAG TPA: DinB family protein [Candidatus Nanopelagicaceae bacterium]